MDDLGDRDTNLTVRLHALKATVEIVSIRGPPEAPEVTLRRLRELAVRSSPASRWAQLPWQVCLTCWASGPTPVWGTYSAHRLGYLTWPYVVYRSRDVNLPGAHRYARAWEVSAPPAPAANLCSSVSSPP